jgi:hypothetical protein
MIGGGCFWAVAVAAATAACASTSPSRTVRPAVESTAMNDVRWDPARGILGCASGDAELTLPRDLRDRVQVMAHDLVVIRPQEPPGALLVTVSPSFLRGKRAGVLGDLPEIWRELHFQATGVDLREGTLQGNSLRAAGGRVVAEYTFDPTPVDVKYRPYAGPDIEGDPRPPPLEVERVRDRTWKVVYVQSGRCRIAAVDRAEVGDKPRLTRLLDELRIPPGLIPR